MKAGVDCETDPLHPCARCISKKQRCSLMPFNEKTGKADRSKLSEADIREYCISQLRKRKGKQPAHGQRGSEASGSGASPLGMLSALELDSGLSHSNSPVDTADSPASAQAAQICIKVPPFPMRAPLSTLAPPATAASTSVHATAAALPARAAAAIPTAPAAPTAPATPAAPSA